MWLSAELTRFCHCEQMLTDPLQPLLVQDASTGRKGMMQAARSDAAAAAAAEVPLLCGGRWTGGPVATAHEEGAWDFDAGWGRPLDAGADSHFLHPLSRSQAAASAAAGRYKQFGVSGGGGGAAMRDNELFEWQPVDSASQKSGDSPAAAAEAAAGAAAVKPPEEPVASAFAQPAGALSPMAAFWAVMPPPVWSFPKAAPTADDDEVVAPPPDQPPSVCIIRHPPCPLPPCDYPLCPVYILLPAPCWHH